MIRAIIADIIQNLIALFQDQTLIIYPVPTPESIAPIYPNIPQKPVTAEATFLELDSTAERPPIRTCGPQVNTPIAEMYT